MPHPFTLTAPHSHAWPPLAARVPNGIECVLVELYRQAKLSHHALALALGRDRLETDELLQRHGVVEDLGSLDDYLRDAGKLAELRKV